MKETNMSDRNLVATTWLTACLIGVAAAAVAAEKSRVDFGRDIRPLLSDTCYTCHGPDGESREADLQLDKKEIVFGTLPSDNVAIVPGHADQSELYRRISTDDIDQRMPPEDHDKQLTADEIGRIKQWIDDGAQWDEHWAFVAPLRPPLPPVEDEAACRGAIDRFLLARLEQENLKPSPEADKTTLIRRVTLDLTGLPPTPQEVDQFVADPSSDAYARLVERLFQSPRYGEQMAHYWLDAARYGDTHGLHLDNERRIWPYRDWVIAALNKNMPFDQFTIEQLAGDLLPDATKQQRIATGFNRCHVTTNEGGVIKEEFHVRNTVDRVTATATVWLGLTTGCAVCHDHKFDPLTRKEFYQLFAFFNSSADDAMDGNAKIYPPVITLPTAAQAAQLKTLNEEIADLEKCEKQAAATLKAAEEKVAEEKAAAEKAAAKQNADRAKQLEATRKQLKSLREKLKAVKKGRTQLEAKIPATMVMQELPKPRDAYDLDRGEYDKRGDKVERAVPAFLPPLPKESPVNRLGLAHWLVDGSNPLTARVTVNRLWQQLFGTGLVATTDNFGSQSEPPSHPELLDWLATELLRSQWDIQHMLRLMVTSAAYRQSAAVTPAVLKVDPQNRLLARGPRFRMDAEMIRDTALFVSGLLAERLGGPGVKPYQPTGIWHAVGYTSSNTANYHPDHGAALYRRSLYTFWKRTAPPPAMVALDAPSRETCVVRRDRTNTPLAALALLNDTQFVEAARCLAERVLRQADADPDAWITQTFQHATARRPDADELSVLRRVYAQQLTEFQADPEAARALIAVGESKPDEHLDPCQLAAMTMVANLILNLDETVTKG
jgi:hypothetical protein